VVINGDFLSIFLIAIGLSADCFAVSLSSGISSKNHSWLQVFRVSSSFGLFQALMPVLGWLAGLTVVEIIADYDHWVAFFDLKSMWPFQYRHGAMMIDEMAQTLSAEKNKGLHHTYDKQS